MEDDGCGETDCREKGVGTAIIAHNNPTPIFDPPEHNLDFLALFVEGLVVAALCHSVLTRWDARGDTLFLEGRDKPIRIIAAVSEQVFGVRKTGQQASRTSVIAGGPCGQQQMHRLAGVVAHRMQLRVQATFRAANRAGAGPFLSRLDAVRWAFRWVASIIRQALGPGCRANSRKILLKIPVRLQRTNRL